MSASVLPDPAALSEEQLTGRACARCAGQLAGAVPAGAVDVGGRAVDLWACIDCSTEAELAGQIRFFVRCAVCDLPEAEEDAARGDLVVVARFDAATGSGASRMAHRSCAEGAGLEVLQGQRSGPVG